MTAALTGIADELATTPDAAALGAVLHQPWATIVLSGAATSAQLAANMRATALTPGTRGAGSPHRAH